jgi:transcription antitermination factor NusG
MEPQGHTDRLFNPELSLISAADELRLHPHWYAAYTCANHEKRVAEQLAGRGVDHYLPQYQAVRRWNHRRVCLCLPLFPGYVFVHISLAERLRVLEVPGLVRLVGFGPLPTALESAEIERLRQGLAKTGGARPHTYLQAGRRVRVCAGPFQGMVGVLKRHKGTCRVVVCIELIQRAISVEVDADAVEPVSEERPRRLLAGA